tara:strand:- start:397 stop:891 length:495 start_codon:yes stop_codon:yes gene_type:complete
MLNITNINTALDGLGQAQELLEDSNHIKTNALGVMLETLKRYEIEGYNVNMVKNAVFEDRGYSYKHYDEKQDKMVPVEGDKAPAKTSTAFSEAKRAYIQFGSLADFDTWEEMRKACKPEDEQADSKAIFKDIMKTAKTLDNGWNTYIEGALTKLQEEVSKAQAK